MEKPGISAYNKLKGPVMEFGYVTESGDKVRVRTMPADGLDHMAIQRHLKFVEQEYVDESFKSHSLQKMGAEIVAGKTKAGADLVGTRAAKRAAAPRIAAAKRLARMADRHTLGTKIKNSAVPVVIGRHPKGTTMKNLYPGYTRTARAAKALGSGLKDTFNRVRAAATSEVKENTDTTYTRREVRKLRLLEAIRKYGDTDA